MNLPNQITLVRILMVPIFMFFLLTKNTYGIISLGAFEISNSELIATLIFIIAASTDGLDGYIARKHKLITNLGKMLDPLADKLLVSAALIALVDLGRIDSWIVIVIISREFAVSGLRMVAAAEGIVVAAGPWGKVKTIVQILAIVVIMMNNFPFTYINIPVDQILIWLAVFFTLYSGIDYFWKNRHVFQLSKDI